MQLLMVIFVVLMILWLFWGGYTAWSGPTPNPRLFGSTIIPWLCVAILGWVLFGSTEPSTRTANTASQPRALSSR